MSSIAISPPATVAPRPIKGGRFALVGLATVVTAVIANVLVYYLGSALIGYDPEFVVLKNVSGTILFTLVPAIVAVLLYRLLPRISSNPDRTFTIVAGMVFVVTLIPDFVYIPTVPGATAGQTAILVLMHVVAAGAIVGMLTTHARPQSR